MKHLIACSTLSLVLLTATGCETTNQIFGIPNDRDRAHLVMTPQQIHWEPATMLPPGAEMAVLEGVPAESGFFAMRLRLPANYQIPPHWHNTNERVTVLSGALHLGMGEQMHREQAQALPASSYASMPPRTRHFVFTEEPTEILIATLGPWDINYVNAADDPRNLRPVRQ
jgi:hypothetical protein